MDLRLINQLHKLKIDTSGIEECSISAWSNKNMPDTDSFFGWFTKYLSQNNVLERSESEEYAYLVAKNLQENECAETFLDLERTHTGIFDVELNKSQLFILKAEYDALKEYERELESEIEANVVVSNHIEKEIRFAKNEMDIFSVKYDISYDICVEQGKEVDTAFSDLRLEVFNCLKNYNTDWSIFYTEKNNQKCKDGLANVSKFCSNLCLNSNSLELEQSNDVDIEALGERLHGAVLYSYIAKAKAKQLEAEVFFYKNFDSLAAAVLKPEDQWCLIQAESLELSKKINAEKSLELLQELMLEYVKTHLDKLDIIKLEKVVLKARKKYENVCGIEKTIMNILSYKAAHLGLFEIIDENIQAMDVFLVEDLPSIVNSDLRGSLHRTGLMKDRIQEQKDEQQKSIEEQNKLIRIIVDLISSKHVEEITPDIFKNLINQFYGTILIYERKLFFNDVELYRSKVNNMEKNNYLIKEHLKSNSSNEIVMCPMEYSSALFKLREASTEAQDIISKIIQYRKYTDETLKGKKWLRVKRQLWMYFLVNPRKVMEYLNEITDENKQKISLQITDDNNIIHNAHKFMHD